MSSTTTDVFVHLALAAADPIFALTASYKADPFPQKVNLGVGAYRDNTGSPYVLPVVRKAKKLLAEDETQEHEYLPIAGLASFVSASAKLIFGEQSAAIEQGLVSTVQTISGTGANHLGALFLSRFYGPWEGKTQAEKIIYISNPTWANHKAIFTNVGCTTVDYPYYDPKTIGLAFDSYVAFLRAAPPQSVFLLHACAHNPTGVDPTREQWNTVCEIFLEKGHYAFFDCAYQGFASGDLENDAWAVRHFVTAGVPLLVCQSYAKNAGLYGERVGALNVVARHAGAGEGGSKRIESQLLILQRSEISNPPTYGARIVSMILNDPIMFAQWKSDIAGMAGRIIEMRRVLHDLLVNKLKTPAVGPNGWDHITSQIGMFCFSGMNPAQCKALIERGHIYLTGNGRISMAGLNDSNVAYFAESLDKAVRGTL